MIQDNQGQHHQEENDRHGGDHRAQHVSKIIVFPVCLSLAVRVQHLQENRTDKGGAARDDTEVSNDSCVPHNTRLNKQFPSELGNAFRKQALGDIHVGHKDKACEGREQDRDSH